MKKNVVKINESQIRKMIAKSIKNAMNEISSGRLNRAVNKFPEIDRSGHAFKDWQTGQQRDVPFDWDYHTAANGIRYIKDALDSFEELYHGTNDNAQVKQCQRCLEYITNFFRRKSEQLSNLKSGYEDYYADEEDAFYKEMGSLLGTNSKEETERAFASLSYEEGEKIASQLSDTARNFYENYF